MILSTEDGQLYFKLWMPLLDYVNKKYKINTDIKRMADPKDLNPRDVKKIADKMWDEVSVIDEYLTKHSDNILKEHKDIIRGWKRRIRGEFVLERHLKKGSIFISVDYEHVFQVSGITSTWEEMFWNYPLPTVIGATFMPFKDVIISDGLVIPFDINIGRNMASSLKDTYMKAKKDKMIRRTL